MHRVSVVRSPAGVEFTPTTETTAFLARVLHRCAKMLWDTWIPVCSTKVSGAGGIVARKARL